MPKISGVGVGESLVGDGNEVAHIDLLIGPRGSAVETAFCNALTNNKDGFTTLLAVIAPNLLCKPPTILYNKVTIKDARQAVQMFGPAQYAVAKAVANSVAEGVIPANEADDLLHHASACSSIGKPRTTRRSRTSTIAPPRKPSPAPSKAIRRPPKSRPRRTPLTTRSRLVERENPQVGGNPVNQVVRAQFGGGSKNWVSDDWACERSC